MGHAIAGGGPIHDTVSSNSSPTCSYNLRRAAMSSVNSRRACRATSRARPLGTTMTPSPSATTTSPGCTSTPPTLTGTSFA